MAGDWIKMRKDLSTDPAVILIADATGLEEDTVVGKLHRVWCWADSQLRDGNAVSVTCSWLDRYTNVAGFAEAMVRAGWLEVTDEGIAFPKFDRHNGQPAKSRALTANRVSASRAKKCNGVSVTEALPEKRREEILIPPNPPLPAKGDFSSRKAAEETFITARLRRSTPEELDAQLAATSTWTDAEFIAAAQEAVAKKSGRLIKPKSVNGNGHSQYRDPKQDAEMVRAGIVKRGRKEGHSEERIEAAVAKALAERGLKLEAAR